MSRIYTVLGGTGFLGSRVVRNLLDAGHRVRVAARHPERSAFADVEGAEPLRADLGEPDSLRAAVTGADGVVNATSLYLEAGDVTFRAIHVEGAARQARIARDAGVARFVQVSGIGADPDAADPYIAARGAGEVAVRDAFPGATIVRPSAIFGPHDALLGAILATLRRLPVYPLFGRGDTRLQPVHVGDVAAAIARLVDSDASAELYELGGPKVYTYRELVSAVARAAELRARPVPVPFPIWQALARIAERLPGAPLTRSQIALVRSDNLASDTMPGLADLDLPARDIAEFVRSGRAEQKEQT